MRGFKTLLGTTALLAGLAMAPAAQAQLVVNIGVQPVCSYGYYGYAPYACAPYGYYGPGYFYNGIFLGMGPWGGWGYSHGWGGHRFVAEGGGNYHGGPGRVSYREPTNQVRGGGQVRSNATVSHGEAKPSTSRPAARAATSHASASHGSTRAPVAHSSGGGGRAGGDERK
jgi:hypothetical protein